MRLLVTGGGGFLGEAIVRQALGRGYRVRSFSRSRYASLSLLGVEQARGDLSDPEALLDAARGCDAVVHTAAKAGVYGAYGSYFGPNLRGTENVLSVCRRLGIKKLVYTSTPSVAHAGADIEMGDERLPYVESPMNHYQGTKAEAEKMVLAADEPALSTVALRPHLIWGPKDPHLVPRILDRARAGRLVLIGEPKLVDTTYVDNAAEAHLCALDRLEPGAACAGKAYFITNHEPRPLDQILNAILEAAGLPPVRRRVPAPLAYAAGAAMELAWGLLGRESEPPLTRFVARQLSTAHCFDPRAARRDLGYEPAISLDEGFLHLRRWLRSAPLTAAEPEAATPAGE